MRFGDLPHCITIKTFQEELGLPVIRENRYEGPTSIGLGVLKPQARDGEMNTEFGTWA